MSIPDELRIIRGHLSTGAFGQREVWERQLEKAADEIERLRAKLTMIYDISQEHLVPAWQVIENVAVTARRALDE